MNMNSTSPIVEIVVSPPNVLNAVCGFATASNVGLPGTAFLMPRLVHMAGSGQAFGPVVGFSVFGAVTRVVILQVGEWPLNSHADTVPLNSVGPSRMPPMILPTTGGGP